jgi:hypothetical protein
MRKFFAVLLCGSMLAVGSCQLDTWNLAVGTGISGGGQYVGVDVDLANGLSFVVPVVPFGK